MRARDQGAHLVTATSSLPKVGVIHTVTYSRNDHLPTNQDVQTHIKTLHYSRWYPGMCTLSGMFMHVQVCAIT